MPSFDSFISASDNSSEQSEMLNMALQLLVTGHAMCDYLLANPDAMAAFDLFISGGKESTEEESKNVRNNIQGAHDVFAAMAAKTKMETILAGLRAQLGNPDSQDIDIDFGLGGIL